MVDGTRLEALRSGSFQVYLASISLGAALVRESIKDKNAKETIDALEKVAAILASYDAESHHPTKNSLLSIEQAIERLESETNISIQ